MKGGSTCSYVVKRGLRGAVSALCKCAESPHKGQASDSIGGMGCGIRAIFVSHLKDFEHRDFKALE